MFLLLGIINNKLRCDGIFVPICVVIIFALLMPCAILGDNYDEKGGEMVVMVGPAEEETRREWATGTGNDDDAGGQKAEVPKSDDHQLGDKQGCAIRSGGFESLHAMMEQICELCHDFFSHQRPNTRVECRSDCFRTTMFKKCLRLFKTNSRTRRNLTHLIVF